MPSITADAVNDVNGVSARCFAGSTTKYIQSKKTTLIIETPPFRKNPFKYFWLQTLRIFYFVRLVMWADVIHWTFDSILPLQLDLKLVQLLRKASFIEWLGSDIRIPEVAGKESPWYKHAFNNGYEYANLESEEKSYSIQHKFKRHGFVPMVNPEMKMFLKPGLFEKVYDIQNRINCSEFQPIYPEPEKKKILIVHAPSAQIAKGTNYIIPVLNYFTEKGLIEYKLLHNMTRSEVLNAMADADVIIDQIIYGSYGIAALEAMCLGKPLVAFISPGLENKYPQDCPIVNANPSTLQDKLSELISDGNLRNSLGIRSRDYVEKYHNADKIALEFINIYRKELNNS